MVLAACAIAAASMRGHGEHLIGFAVFESIVLVSIVGACGSTAVAAMLDAADRAHPGRAGSAGLGVAAVCAALGVVAVVIIPRLGYRELSRHPELDDDVLR